MNLLQKRRQKRPTKIGTRLLGSEMPVPISRSHTVIMPMYVMLMGEYDFLDLDLRSMCFSITSCQNAY